jgi:hypothetical protein
MGRERIEFFIVRGRWPRRQQVCFSFLQSASVFSGSVWVFLSRISSFNREARIFADGVPIFHELPRP